MVIRLKNKLSVARITRVGVILTSCIAMTMLLYALWLHGTKIDTYEMKEKISTLTTLSLLFSTLSIFLKLIWRYAKKNNK